jgi:hypothetical protein
MIVAKVLILSFSWISFLKFPSCEQCVLKYLLISISCAFQSWEKTVDCYSPGQGLMPASFKVRSVPLDGNNEAFEEVLDPDFGESAIGRVAPVDSGECWVGLCHNFEDKFYFHGF